MLMSYPLSVRNHKNIRIALSFIFQQQELPNTTKKLSYRRGTARCVVSIEILPIATQQCRNYLYDKS